MSAVDSSPLLEPDVAASLAQALEEETTAKRHPKGGFTTSNWIDWFLIGGGSCAAIANLVPYFAGETCDGIPSVFVWAITFTVLNMVQAPFFFVNNYYRMKAGLRCSYDTTPPKDIGELYRGHNVCNVVKGMLGLASLLVGDWGFVLAMLYTKYKGVDSEECHNGIYTLLFISGIICMVITILMLAFGMAYFTCREKIEALGEKLEEKNKRFEEKVDSTVERMKGKMRLSREGTREMEDA